MRFSSTVPQTKLGPDPEKVVTQILREYKIVSADVLAREEITVDQLVDVIIGKLYNIDNISEINRRAVTDPKTFQAIGNTSPAYICTTKLTR